MAGDEFSSPLKQPKMGIVKNLQLRAKPKFVFVFKNGLVFIGRDQQTFVYSCRAVLSLGYL